MRIDGSARRRFLGQTAGVGLAVAAILTDDAMARARAAVDRAGDRDPDDVARDEAFWREIQLAFTLDRSIINLNNGGVCPSPRVVHEAYKRYLDFSNQAPVYHMWQVLEPNLEAVRRKLAASAGCDPEEMAITRNASEALQIAQLGLDLEPGDEVVTTNQDYGRMLDTWEQRARRNGIVLKKIAFPVPPPSLDDLARRFEARDHAADEGDPLLPHHQPDRADLPGADICAHGPRPRHPHHRRRRARLGHFPFKLRDLECDYYGTSLHKWLLAPIGTGFLYVRRDRIKDLWPLTPRRERLEDDIRKFEEIGTHPAATTAAITEALVFHQTIGMPRKAARLRYLRAALGRAAEDAGARPHPHQLRPGAVRRHRHRRHRGHGPAAHRDAPVGHGAGSSSRRSSTTNTTASASRPNIYTTLEEIDTFAAAMERLKPADPPARTAG